MKKFEAIYKGKLVKDTMTKFNYAGKIRDNVMHGKNEKDENKRKAINDIIDYSDPSSQFGGLVSCIPYTSYAKLEFPIFVVGNNIQSSVKIVLKYLPINDMIVVGGIPRYVRPGQEDSQLFLHPDRRKLSRGRQGQTTQNCSLSASMKHFPNLASSIVLCQAKFPEFATMASRKTPREIPGFRHRVFSRVTCDGGLGLLPSAAIAPPPSRVLPAMADG